MTHQCNSYLKWQVVWAVYINMDIFAIINSYIITVIKERNYEPTKIYLGKKQMDALHKAVNNAKTYHDNYSHNNRRLTVAGLHIFVVEADDHLDCI